MMKSKVKRMEFTNNDEYLIIALDGEANPLFLINWIKEQICYSFSVIVIS